MKTFVFISIFLCTVFGQMTQQQFPSQFRVAQEPVKDVLEEEKLPLENSLDMKFTSAVSILINREILDEKILRAAIRHALDATFTSNMVVLPTGDVELPGKSTPSFNMYNTTMSKITILLRGLNLKLRMFLVGTEETTALGTISTHMLEIRDFLLFTKEILETLSVYTRKCDPSGDLARQESFCRALLSSDESEKIFDGVLKENVNKFIRNPFFFVDAQQAFVALKGQRQNKALADVGIFTFSTPSLAAGECHAVMEQVAGMQALLRPAQLSLFQIPFLSKTDAVNKMVWIFEWVPAEYWKTISFCHEVNAESKLPSIKKYIDTQVVLERSMLNMWFPFGLTGDVTLPPSGH